ncbi:hypothetical protein VHEMI00064 [[Torrubiella] hemipterigena]|uniref:Uncharacterized protein n=1 Tax=[Torrubiella] hemipterigena TaxID=1531966 RepID=A0A0A1T3C3_9HYPO|nr:hypothetical protein VHEMI00064 [[Torrubiella] hemipterigena]
MATPTSTPPKGISDEFIHRMDPDYVKYHTENLSWWPMNHTIPIEELRASPKNYGYTSLRAALPREETAHMASISTFTTVEHRV